MWIGRASSDKIDPKKIQQLTRYKILAFVKGPVKLLMEPHLIGLATDVTCHMRSHSVTCHPTQVNTPRLNPIYLPRRDASHGCPCPPLKFSTIDTVILLCKSFSFPTQKQICPKGRLPRIPFRSCNNSGGCESRS